MKLRKYLYKYAYYYTHKCQKTFFYLYLKKYIKKHRKYRTINEEYHILTKLIVDNQVSFDNDNNLLKKYENSIIDYLYKENLRLYSLSRSNYTLDSIIDYHQPYIIEKMCVHLNFNIDTRCIKDIILFSINLRRVFFNSEVTAKSKVQEHWIARLPFFIFCVSCILILKLTDISYNNNTNIHIKIVLYLSVYLMSIFLVFIRVHQSIIADTKKNLSEVYYKSKKLLYKRLIIETEINLDSKIHLLYDEKEKIEICLYSEKN